MSKLVHDSFIVTIEAYLNVPGRQKAEEVDKGPTITKVKDMWI